MVKVAICDDYKTTIEILKQAITKIAKEKNIELIISTYTSGEEMYNNIINSIFVPDIIFLDILLNEENGIDIATDLRRLNFNFQLVFVTSSEKDVFKSFDSNPINYLIKGNLTYAQLSKVFSTAIDNMFRINYSNTLIEVKPIGAPKKYIDINTIVYIESIGRVIRFHTNSNQTIDIYSSIKETLSHLSEFPNFIRVHKSAAINTFYIISMHSKSVVLRNGITLEVGRTYYNKLMAILQPT